MHITLTQTCIKKKLHIKGVIFCYPLPPVNRMQVVSLELTYFSSIMIQNFARRKMMAERKKPWASINLHETPPEVHFISHYLPFTIYLHLINNAYLYLIIC